MTRPAARPPGSFGEVRVRVPPRAGEGAANFLLERGAAGLVEGGPGGARGVLLAAHFASRRRAREAARALRRYLRALRALGVLRGGARVAVRAVRGSAWSQRWKRYARPVRVGRRLVVRPSWVRARRPAGVAVVTLDPGMAFGTGSHATTRLCLEALAWHLAGGERVLDVGTGSGILAIAAVKLGARGALGLDTDPVACGVARENVRANGVHARVRVRRGEVGGCAARGFDVAVANLTAGDLVDVLPRLTARVRPGGLVVVSGILPGQEAAVRQAARAAGLGPPAARRRAGWVALEARRTLH